MVARRAEDQVQGTLKQPYRATVSIEWQVTMKYAKKCNYLSSDSRLENGWRISHLCPYRHKCSTFLLHMHWYSSRFQCNKRSLLNILIDHKSWQIPGVLPFPPCFRKGFFAYSMVTCCVTANITADILLPEMYSWRWAKLKLCQYKSTMVTRRARDQVKEPLKQPYQTTVSIEWLPCFSLMQQVTMKYAKKCNYLRRNGRLENGWHISHLCPYRHKCSTFHLHMP